MPCFRLTACLIAKNIVSLNYTAIVSESDCRKDNRARNKHVDEKISFTLIR